MDSPAIAQSLRPLLVDIYEHYGKANLAKDEIDNFLQATAESPGADHQIILANLSMYLHQIEWRSLPEIFVLKAIRTLPDLFKGGSIQSQSHLYPLLFAKCCIDAGFKVLPEQRLGSRDCDIFLQTSGTSIKLRPLVFNVALNKTRLNGIPVEHKSTRNRAVTHINSAIQKFATYGGGVVAIDVTQSIESMGEFGKVSQPDLDDNVSQRLNKVANNIKYRMRNQGNKDFFKYCPAVILTCMIVNQSRPKGDPVKTSGAAMVSSRMALMPNMEYKFTGIKHGPEYVYEWSQTLGKLLSPGWSRVISSGVSFGMQPLCVEIGKESVSVEVGDGLKIQRHRI